MTDRLVVHAPQAITADWLAGSADVEAPDELVSAVVIAICTDRRAKADDELPQPDSQDRRGWWGDTDAALIRDGGPIGSRLWLLERATILGPEARKGATTARVDAYLREALQPFKDARIASKFSVSVARTGVESIGAGVTLYRGNTPDVELRFADLWSNIQG